MVVAIDGPAGAGKSTVARKLAEALGFRYLDSGAMYRAAALAALERGGDPVERATAADIDVSDRVLLDGRDVTEAIRSPEVTEASSRIAASPVEDVVSRVVALARDTRRRCPRRASRSSAIRTWASRRWSTASAERAK